MNKIYLSETQKAFLRSEYRHARLVRLSRFLLLFAFLALWELTADVSLIDGFIFSSPSRIVQCLVKMTKDGSLFLHTWVTLYETLVSFALVIGLGIGVALLLWCSKTLSQILEPFLVVLGSLPKSALAPLLIVWLGNNQTTIITAAVSVALFGSILTLYAGFSQFDETQVKLVRSLGAGKAQILRFVLLPGSLPLIVSTMKVNIGLCLVGVIIGEFLSSKAGLGYLITYASQTFAMTTVITAIVILCLISTILYQAVAWLEKKLS